MRINLPFELYIVRINDPRMRIRRYDLLAQGLRAPADEEEAPRDAVHALPQGVGALHAAGDRVGADTPFDRNPGVAPAEQFQGVADSERVPAEQDDGVADGRAQVDARGGDCFGDGFQPPEPDAEAADGVGIPGAEAFEFGAAQTQCLHRGCLLSQPGAVVFDARGQGILVLCEAAGFVAVTGIAVCQQRRCEDGVKEKVFFHGFRVLRRR